VFRVGSDVSIPSAESARSAVPIGNGTGANDIQKGKGIGVKKMNEEWKEKKGECERK
jgi:hypothetical protein